MKHQGMRKLMALLLAAVLVLPCVAASAFAEPASGENGSVDGAITVGGRLLRGILRPAALLIPVRTRIRV